MQQLEKSITKLRKNDLIKLYTNAQQQVESLRSQLQNQQAHSYDANPISSILSLSPEAISLIRLEDGAYVDINDAFVQLTGYKRSEVLGKTTKEITIWSKPSERIKFLRAVKKKHRYNNYKSRFTAKNGKEYIALISARIITFKNEDHLICFTRDITDYENTNERLQLAQKKQKNITDELENTTKLLEAIFNSIPDLIGIQNVDHRIIRYNKAGYQMLNISPEEAQGKCCFELIGLTEPCKVCATTETYKTKKPARIEKYVPENKIWFDVRSYPILNKKGGIEFVIEHLRDITAEKNITEALKKSAERLELALKGADLGMWDWNLNSGELNHSARWCTMLGYTPEEINSDFKAWEKLVHPDDYQQVLDKLQEHLEGKTEFYETEHRLKTKQGEWRWILDRGKIVDRNPDGTVKRLAGTHLDITNRKSAEEENKRLQAQLTQARKMEAVGTLAGGIAHDFNNLLTVINGYSEITLMKLDDQHPAQKDVIAIKKAGERAENLTRQLLAFSRKQVFEPRTLDLNTVIKGLESMIRRLIGEDIDIDAKLSPSLPAIKADPGQIEQILINLLINARDAINQRTDTASEKRITVETSYTFLDKHYVNDHIYSQSGPHVLFSVTDTGIGMKKDILNKIFEPFFTTKERGKGTGLGLATVYGIVKQNDGHITVYSEPDEGTTFKIYWPVCDDEIISDSETENIAETLFGDESILLVEDDSGVRSFASNALSGFGYRVTAATNGLEALELLKNNDDDRFDLLVTDLIMPQMNGHELASEFYKLFPKGLVLYTSGYPENHIVRNGHLEEGLNFIHKPYSVKAIAKKVREVLDENRHSE